MWKNDNIVKKVCLSKKHTNRLDGILLKAGDGLVAHNASSLWTVSNSGILSVSECKSSREPRHGALCYLLAERQDIIRTGPKHFAARGIGQYTCTLLFHVQVVTGIAVECYFSSGNVIVDGTHITPSNRGYHHWP